MLDAEVDLVAVHATPTQPPLPPGRHGAPILIVLHQEQSSPGHVGQILADRGYALDIRRPRFGDPLPSTLRHHAGTVIFGGPMSVNDAEHYISQEIGLAELALREQRPLLGICLGAQILARALGARVAPHPDAHVEIGYHPVAATIEAAALGGPWPDRFYQWHREGFDLPSRATLLAHAAGPFANQAFRYGPAAIGLQFHPEITYGMVARWTIRGDAKLSFPGAHPRTQQMMAHMANAAGVRIWLARFLEDWLALSDSVAKVELVENA